ncbi:MAG: hypothetical protein Ta2D_08410 [Rickettsiales bacterium]|nr:MAG: hypothetical protein Ta2D_08410 [Rickettsiales bacterium]
MINEKEIREKVKKMDKMELKKAIISGNKEILKKYKPTDEWEERYFEMLRTETINDIEFRDDLGEEFDKAQEEFRKEYKAKMDNKNKSVNIFSALKNKIAVL